MSRLILLTALWAGVLCAQTKSTPPPESDRVQSPDGQFTVVVDSTVEVVNAAGQTVLLLGKSTSGVKQVEISWSPDSRRVVVLENLGRGSGVLAAWHDGPAWHKTLQLDADQTAILRQVQDPGHLFSENRSLGDWISYDALAITGGLTFSNGRVALYHYTLEFVSGPTKLDRGGYEEGAVRGTNYRLQ